MTEISKSSEQSLNNILNKKKDTSNNPMTPEDDINHLYYWTDCYKYPL